MKKLIYKYLIAASLIFSATSCDLDINENPNFPKDADPSMLLSSAMAWSVSAFGVETQITTSMWAQYYAQNNASNQYTNYDRYNISNTSFNRLWQHEYAGALQDLYLARSKSEAQSEWQYWITSQVLIAFDYHILNDLFGTIPFTQAVDFDNHPAPKYDDSKTVNAGIIAILDAAIAKQADAADKSSMGSNDLIYAGNIDRWVEFAKTLKLKILMRDFETNKNEIQALLTAGGLLTADASVKGFEDKENKSNPLYEFDRRKLNTQENIKASATMITFLKEYNDPRIEAYYEPNQSGEYQGLPQGGYNITQKVIPSASLSRARLAATDPVYLMSVAESHFLQAEAYARLANEAGAKASYEAGVTAAFDRWGYDASSFIAAGGAYEFKDTDLETMIKCIITQKWVAAVRCQGFDAFFDINRTGYPKLGTEYTVVQDLWTLPNANYVVGELTPSATSVLGKGEYPKRFILPKNSTDNNPNAPAVINITEKMWWHK
ncbi:SusD/RagB family nutrient-binding outer membrane lipoprotein [Prevotella sp. 10(H)]|uniref:SusD/RagB family nutrient-binding outer membrane lipoprotein n=1 Tax=Prevotella sp. 10(H) TaxID=1158294 RepID=UPI0004A6B14A|nr:SusD/RagB family nutrient-binding outer membrane lipoprotein [Prevotella sp. 10(H)]